jgi:hypothetical protein
MQTVPKLSGQAASLFAFLSQRQTADTVELRRMLDIGNVSDVAFKVNARLALAGDSRRVVCQHQGRKGVWCLDRATATAA